MAYYANEAGRRKATEFGQYRAFVAQGSGNSIAALAISAYSITSNVVTFTVASTSQLAVGQQALISAFPTATFFNAQTVTIASIPTATTFTAAFTHANASATEAGKAAIVQSLQVNSNLVDLLDGSRFNPFSTNASILIGIGGNQETVTPVSVSGNTITAPFANIHGQSDLIQSGTAGLQEAINYCVANGGIVEVGPAWGGTTAMLLAASYQSIVVEDVRSGALPVYYNGSPNQPIALGTMQTAQVALSSAQLLAIQTTAVNIVVAPGAGFVLIPKKLVVEYKFVTTAYTIANADNAFRLQYTGKTTSLASTLATGLMDQSASTTGFVEPVSPITGIANSNCANLGLELKLAIGTTPALTLGDGTAVVTIQYLTVAL